ncbi:MAG: hypothetical protein KF729_26545 [Sandaracinaceae bacterium]|nr:hypothetical protein [Sandaracinaceae bacterium]
MSHSNASLASALLLASVVGCDPACRAEGACAFDPPDALEIDSLGALSISEIRPADGVDYVALHVGRSPVSTYGTACARAADPAACGAAIDALPAATGFGNACGLPAMCPARLVVTRGDEVLAIDTLEGMLDVLGSIDAPAEAALVVFASRPERALPYAGYDVHRVAAVPGGFEVWATYLESDCDPIVTRGAVVHVPANGAPDVACDRVTSCTPDVCI